MRTDVPLIHLHSKARDIYQTGQSFDSACYEVAIFTHCFSFCWVLLSSMWKCLFVSVFFGQTPIFNAFTARLIQAFRVKSSCSHMSLRRHNSGTRCARELFKLSKDSAGLQVTSKKEFFGYGFRVFLWSDVMSGVHSGLFGPLHLALGPNC